MALSAVVARTTLLSGLSAAVLAGCSGGTAPPNPDAPDRDVARVVEGNTAFALDLYQELRGRQGNLFFSPHSISTALAMAYIGARTDTAQQMKQTLHYDLPGSKLHPAMGTLAYRLYEAAEDGDAELQIANRLWGDESFEFQPFFLEATSENYGSGFQSADFRNARALKDEINAWVSGQTNGRITDLLQARSITRDTALIMISAIYFKGSWAEQFKTDYTVRKAFYVTPDSSVGAWLMRQNEEFRFHRDDLVHVLELPYAGDRLTMLLVLPTERHGLAAVEDEMTAENLSAWIDDMYEQDVAVTLPRFTLRYRVELADVLTSMGMSSAFDRQLANFFGMNDWQRLFLGKVVHEAYVEVNEEGTEAAAATVASDEKTAEELDPPTFKADQPFIFFIRDRETGAILFMGRVSDPSEYGPIG